MIINTNYDICVQSTSWYLQLQLIRNRWPPRKHVSNSIDEEPEHEPEPYIYRTPTEHEPNSFKCTHNPNRTEPLSSKNPNLTRTSNFGVISHLYPKDKCCVAEEVERYKTIHYVAACVPSLRHGGLKVCYFVK